MNNKNKSSIQTLGFFSVNLSKKGLMDQRHFLKQNMELFAKLAQQVVQIHKTSLDTNQIFIAESGDNIFVSFVNSTPFKDCDGTTNYPNLQKSFNKSVIFASQNIDFLPFVQLLNITKTKRIIFTGCFYGGALSQFLLLRLLLSPLFNPNWLKENRLYFIGFSSIVFGGNFGDISRKFEKYEPFWFNYYDLKQKIPVYKTRIFSSFSAIGDCIDFDGNPITINNSTIKSSQMTFNCESLIIPEVKIDTSFNQITLSSLKLESDIRTRTKRLSKWLYQIVFKKQDFPKDFKLEDKWLRFGEFLLILLKHNQSYFEQNWGSIFSVSVQYCDILNDQKFEFFDQEIELLRKTLPTPAKFQFQENENRIKMFADNLPLYFALLGSESDKLLKIETETEMIGIFGTQKNGKTTLFDLLSNSESSDKGSLKNTRILKSNLISSEKTLFDLPAFDDINAYNIPFQTFFASAFEQILVLFDIGRVNDPVINSCLKAIIEFSNAKIHVLLTFVDRYENDFQHLLKEAQESFPKVEFSLHCLGGMQLSNKQVLNCLETKQYCYGLLKL
jgi:hypothetical protein